LPDAVHPAKPDVARLRRELAAAFRATVRFGMHEGVCNHFSLAIDDNRTFLMNPHGMHFAHVRASSLLMIDVEGRSVDAEEKRHTAFYIHSRIHRANPGARAVLHAHPVHATALAMIEGGRLLPCHQNSLRFYDRCAYYDHFGGLVFDDREGDRIAAALADRSVLFMKNHGVIVTGASVAEALDDLYYLEKAAQAQVVAMSTGVPLALVPQDVASASCAQFKRVLAGNAHKHFNELLAILDREEPDYAN
jgi:ribulose-5-phosphate 4-epimerase/fuculose-1-phosphate aldolase